MRLEDTLTAMGNDPISELENFRATIAYINSQLTKVGMAIVDAATPSDKVLEIIYSLDNQEVQTRILDRTVKEVVNDKRFKNLLVGSAVLVTIIALCFFGFGMLSGTPLTPEAVEIWKQVWTSVFEIVKLLIASIAS